MLALGAPTSTLTLRRGTERRFTGWRWGGALLAFLIFPGRKDPGPWARGWLGGGVDAPRFVFISQKMPHMPEAQAGVRRSPCAAVTNTAPPLFPDSRLSHLPRYEKEEAESVLGKGGDQRA